MKTTLPYCIIILLILSCCGEMRNRAHLDAINSIAETDGRLALSMLDSVKDRDYSTSDRMYYDLLTVKSRDKAYIDHENDSLIKRVISYYEATEGDKYAEALYYGGRVYSDLGDYPTSLRYYQRALDELPADARNLHVRGNVISQLGRLLIEMRLFSQAVPYLEEVIEIDKIEGDSFNLAFDYELLERVYVEQRDYDKAEFYIRRALDVGKNLDFSHKYDLNISYADLKNKLGQNESALNLIRTLLDSVSYDSAPFFNICASKIYYKNEIFDTAYHYSREILRSNNLGNKRGAYLMLLKPEIRQLIPIDTLLFYYKDYNKVVEEYFNRHDSQQVLMQTSMYNYELHERESQRAKKSRQLMFNCLLVSVILILLLSVAVLYSRFREKSRLVEMRDAQLYIEELKLQIDRLNSREKESEPALQISTGTFDSDEASLEKMRKELISMAENSDLVDSMSDFKMTEVYDVLSQKIEEDRVVIEDKDLMKQVEGAILLKSPKFKSNLYTLSRGKLTEIEYKTCMLIKLGFKPTRLAVLIGLTKGSVSSRREGIGVKILGEKTPVATVDKIVKLL